MADNELKSIVNQFFAILDTVEESDSGNLFHPTQISSCRIADIIKLEPILKRMKELANE